MTPTTKKRLRVECHGQQSKICTDADLLRAHLTVLAGPEHPIKRGFSLGLVAFRDLIPELLRKRHWAPLRETEFFNRRETDPATDVWVDEQFEDSNA
jgi:hypothetical protein